MASIKKIDSGWQFRVHIRQNGKRHTKTVSGFVTKREAQIAAADYEKKYISGVEIGSADIAFSEYFQKWFEVFREGKFSWKNEQHVKYAIKLAADYFGNTKLKDINRISYQKFINDYAENHATETVQKVHTYCRACIRDAFEEGIILKDPTTKIKVVGKVKPKSKDEKFLSLADLTKLADEVKNNFDPKSMPGYMILFAIDTGARYAEICGMTWDCVDFENEKIEINKTWDYQKTHTFGPTKNETSNRTVSISEKTVAMLKLLKLNQAELMLRTGMRNKHNLVFLDFRYGIISNNGANKYLKKMCEQADIQTITFHPLRHTSGSVLLYDGASVQWVSKRLGHKDINETLKTYTHVFYELEERDTQIGRSSMSKIL